MTKSYDVIGYTYEADIHCPECTRERFPDPDNAVDDEGNDVQPIFADQFGDLIEEVDDDYGRTVQYAPRCSDCGEELLEL
jgi:hypothetical protein